MGWKPILCDSGPANEELEHTVASHSHSKNKNRLSFASLPYLKHSLGHRSSMMAKFLIVLSLVILVLAILTEAVNFKKDYCGNQDYVGNNGNKYPHLHCGKSFLTLSRSRKRHNNLQRRCNKVLEILNNWKYYYGRAKQPCAITTVLQNYYNDKCLVASSGLSIIHTSCSYWFVCHTVEQELSNLTRLICYIIMILFSNSCRCTNQNNFYHAFLQHTCITIL